MKLFEKVVSGPIRAVPGLFPDYSRAGHGCPASCHGTGRGAARLPHRWTYRRSRGKWENEKKEKDKEKERERERERERRKYIVVLSRVNIHTSIAVCV